jgi:hypothetical protein
MNKESKTKAAETVEAAKKEGEDKAVIERIAGLDDDLVRARESKKAAKALGVDPGDVKRAVKQRRAQLTAARPSGDATELAEKPSLIISSGDLPGAAYAIRDLLAGTGQFFERSVPVMLVMPADGGLPVAVQLTHCHVVLEAHKLAQPIAAKTMEPATLSKRVAELYLSLNGQWNLPPLNGITTAPLLGDDGSIRLVDGYDSRTGLWCARMPEISVPDRPTEEETQAALWKLRVAFHTFPFADAARTFDRAINGEIVDLDESPGLDESGFLHGLLTATCRASLDLAPGLILSAPKASGSGSGKGFLAKAIGIIAFGDWPQAITRGSDGQEFEKRLAAALIGAQPYIYLDNFNNAALRSDTLSSIMTERLSLVRTLGVSRNELIKSNAFICITGNAISATEDLARRFFWSSLNARMEDPEQRRFQAGFLEGIKANRSELLSAALTIWRWGRQSAASLKRGKPLGGFEQWAEWCRDPLLTLGMPDPVERIGQMKARDPYRQRIATIFEVWNAHHGQRHVAAAELADDVKEAISPGKTSRQQIATAVQSLADTRLAGYVLLRHEPPGKGKWSSTKYQLNRTSERETAEERSDVEEEREKNNTCERGLPIGGHGGHEVSSQQSVTPMTPMNAHAETALHMQKNMSPADRPPAAAEVKPFIAGFIPPGAQCRLCGSTEGTVRPYSNGSSAELVALHEGCVPRWFVK